MHTHICNIYARRHAHTHMYARTYVHTSIYVCSQEMTVTVAKASYIASYTHIHYTKSSSTLLLFQTRPPIAVCMYVCTTVLSTLTHCAWDPLISRKCHDCWWIAMLWLLRLVLWGLYLHYVNVGMVIYTTHTYILYVDEPAICRSSVKCTHSKTYEILVMCTRLQQASKTPAQPKACLCALA